MACAAVAFPIRARGGSVLVAAVIGLAWATAVAAADPWIEYEAGTLTVRIDRIPLDEVLAAVAHETGMTIVGEPLDRRDVVKRFDGVALVLALRRLVGRQNFVLRYGADGRPERLELLGRPLGRPQPRPRRSLQALRLFLAQPAVDLPPRAARALGGARLPIRRLLAGLRHDDALVREESARAVVLAVERDAGVLEAFRKADATDLANVVSTQARGYAADVAARLYRAARDPGLRSKLATMIAAVGRAVG
jgi:hypothetical protein